MRSRRDEMPRVLGGVRLWESGGEQQVLHKLNLRRDSHLLLSHKEKGAFMDLWPRGNCVEFIRGYYMPQSRILLDNKQGEREERAQ